MSYVVRPTPAAAALITKLPAGPRSQLGPVIKEVEANGCRAAGYRLWRGDESSGLCCRHFAGDWRIIFLFPEPSRITVCWVGQHNSMANVYADLAGVSAELSPEGRAERVPCCTSESEPPSVPQEVADSFNALHTRDVARAAR